jgi:hypothetical protein
LIASRSRRVGQAWDFRQSWIKSTLCGLRHSSTAWSTATISLIIPEFPRIDAQERGRSLIGELSYGQRNLKPNCPAGGLVWIASLCSRRGLLRGRIKKWAERAARKRS